MAAGVFGVSGPDATVDKDLDVSTLTPASINIDSVTTHHNVVQAQTAVVTVQSSKILVSAQRLISVSAQELTKIC